MSTVERNPYDITKECEGGISIAKCYPLTKYVVALTVHRSILNYRGPIRYLLAYLDLPEVRRLLGVDDAITGNFSVCTNKVDGDFAINLDEYRPTQLYVAALLERKIKILIYAGTNDWICNHVGNEAWTLDLEWSGHDEFSTQALREWKVDGKTAGSTRSAQGLTFATINDAGHAVRSDSFTLFLSSS